MKTSFRLMSLLIFWIAQITSAESFNGFDLSNSLIDKKYISQGGPPRDGIPSLSEPKYVLADSASFMRANDIVLGFKIANQAIAYPRHILNWHEVVNDEVSGKPFIISYCPLCGSGVAFSSRVDKKRLTFGVSGLLYNSGLIFYDYQTESLWSQLEGRAIAGDMVGKKLQRQPLEHMSWKAWLSRNPDTKVLSDDQGFKRNYRHDPYTGYDTSSQLFFKTLRDAPNTFHPKEKVLGIKVGEQSKAYPFSELKKHKLNAFDDQLGGVNFQVVWDDDANSATLIAKSGEVMTPIVAFWFAWYNFHPDTQVFSAPSTQ